MDWIWWISIVPKVLELFAPVAACWIWIVRVTWGWVSLQTDLRRSGPDVLPLFVIAYEGQVQAFSAKCWGRRPIITGPRDKEHKTYLSYLSGWYSIITIVTSSGDYWPFLRTVVSRLLIVCDQTFGPDLRTDAVSPTNFAKRVYLSVNLTMNSISIVLYWKAEALVPCEKKYKFTRVRLVFFRLKS